MIHANLSNDTLCALMPLHAIIGSTGHILATGPTLAKLVPEYSMVGRRVLEVFEFRRPSAPGSFSDLLTHAGKRLSLQFRGSPRTAFKGLLMPLADEGGALLNLSFGIGAVAAVAEHRLTAGDFAPTDLTVEMLYLVEAKSAAMEESRRLNQKLEGARSAAEEQALTDALTGLRNRRALEDALARLLASRTRFGLIHLDLDRFKEVNDTLGHGAGDAVLGTVADALHAETREGDLAARVGGDEFLLVFPLMTDVERLKSVAQRIISRIEEPVAYGAETCSISASAGITVSTAYALPTADRMLNDADEALYHSKRTGRGRATIWGRFDEGAA